jgi:hypothetical protein
MTRAPNCTSNAIASNSPTACVEVPIKGAWTISSNDFYFIFGILHTIVFTLKSLDMATPRSSRGASKQEPKPRTVQRTYRFDTKLFEAFEDDCATHLANPKRVIEALILHWLDAGREERAAMAHKHRARVGLGARDDE